MTNSRIANEGRNAVRLFSYLIIARIRLNYDTPSTSSNKLFVVRWQVTRTSGTLTSDHALYRCIILGVRSTCRRSTTYDRIPGTKEIRVPRTSTTNALHSATSTQHLPMRWCRDDVRKVKTRINLYCHKRIVPGTRYAGKPMGNNRSWTSGLWYPSYKYLVPGISTTQPVRQSR